jgi:hypothetical protein
MLACMLHVQILYMGLTCYFLEYWLERAMGNAKQRTRGKITAQPAHVVVSMELDNRAQRRAALELGMLLQEDEVAQDGIVVIPRTVDSSNSIAAILGQSAAAGTCSLVGAAAIVPNSEWQEMKVGTQHCGCSSCGDCCICSQLWRTM